MSWLAKLLTGGAEKIVDSLGSSIDKLVTSDEERLKLKAVMERDMYEHEQEVLDAVSRYDKEVSGRHRNDMKSDSWLSKNVRPLILIFLTVTTVGLAYSTIFILEPEDAGKIEPWASLLQVLLVTAYSFYFGSRGFEKVKSMKNDGR